MTDLNDTIAALVRQQTLRVHYLPGDPTAFYTARAPCLLAQLQAAVASSNSGHGGRTIPASRLPLAAEALDLWIEITANVHGWADAIGLDRRRYRAAERATFAAPERVPAWLHRLWPWLGTDARQRHWTGDQAGPARPALPEPEPAVHPVPLDDTAPLADRTVPPIGQLLRAAAAEAVARGLDEMADRIAYKAHGWAQRIAVMLAGWAADERLYPIRGEACPACSATTASEQRADGETYRVPAVQVRFMPVEGGDLWAYRMCIACGDNGWVEYTTETPDEAA